MLINLNNTQGIAFPVVAQALYQKQGRSSQFASVAERDAWIRAELKQLEKVAAKKHASQTDILAQTQQLSAELLELSQACLSLLQSICLSLEFTYVSQGAASCEYYPPASLCFGYKDLHTASP